MTYLNLISFFGIFGLCAIAWLFSENRRVIPWRVMIGGIGLQLILGALVFWFPPTRDGLQVFSGLLDGVFTAADAGARFVFGPTLVPNPDRPPAVAIGYVLAFRALPAVIFFSGLMALLYNLGVIQLITTVFADIFYKTMRLSGAESLSGAANIFVGIEAAIAVKPYIAQMTRSELCAILACCFGTAASSTLAIYVSFLRPIFPNILGHLVSASIMGIPACFVLSKLLVPETEVPVTAGGIPTQVQAASTPEPEADPEAPPQEYVAGEPIERVSPMDAAILGALEGVRMAVSIAAVLILIVGMVSLINQMFEGLATLPAPIGPLFQVVTLQNIQGVLFYPLTLLTGVPFNESWEASVIIGRRLLETAIPSFRALAEAGARPENPLSPRTILIVSYALSGFAHVASVGIFVGGTIALAPSRRKDITELGWKALFVGTLATLMIACVAGFFDNGNPSIIGTSTPNAIEQTAPASPTASPATAPTNPPLASPSPPASPTSTPISPPTVSPAASPTVSPNPAPTGSPTPAPLPSPTP
ncbi:nucleoside:proton symporter [Trichothermofontia sichuanensis B231]|uniref:nucleoside transporter C-terminal domain-containing protein n=1 Tax=Trichothermofontia sichuanensis TaxID=3045816 RepID=UPI0022476F02|nr:nucleoside transporter C-terminal domain-containing protein [Trichothermofontia sichuanensis]UZQ55649.1 nucleoside:proton symporter [Trichothermofontia sichuanensis B231]